MSVSVTFYIDSHVGENRPYSLSPRTVMWYLSADAPFWQLSVHHQINGIHNWGVFSFYVVLKVTFDIGLHVGGVRAGGRAGERWRHDQIFWHRWVSNFYSGRAPPRTPEVPYKFNSKKKQCSFIACLKRSYNVCVIWRLDFIHANLLHPGCFQKFLTLVCF